MPLYYSAPIGKHGRLGLWKISESIDELAKLFVTTPQTEIPKHELRKKEFIASRCLVDRLLNQQTGTSCAGIAKTSDGMPYILESRYQCSISHDTDYAAALIHKDQAPGIDIARIDAQVLSVTTRFLSTKEQESCPNTRAATLYWATKEAIYKHTKGQLKEFKLICIEVPPRLEMQGRLRVRLPKDYGSEIDVGYFFFADYVIAYTPYDLRQPPLTLPQKRL